ncbi:TonB-dependent receptor [Pseudoduganella danionis]|uniref:TonB-dependent receptor n=1 Tax=Pseudoduganella danionis TaxID=1890295 RepID=A0ABW9SPF3_9BURK|nr:TonB-dependent receptor [Pseudoduganella danionis]MTW32279.1 TonB-dependent receptor [Pseudoduganella danionis]
MQQKKLVVALAAVYGLGWTVLANASPAELAVATVALSSAALATSAEAGAASAAADGAGASASADAAETVAAASAATAAADASLDVIARVTVSARRRVESSQSVPTTLSVLDSSALEGNRVYRVQDLQQLLPSTTVNYVHARQMSFAVRGLGNNPASDGLEGSVGVYLDNVYLARPGMAAFDALDIQQLELLRGPQGTLFGKNTTAGVLNITSKQPTYRSENSAQLAFGQQGYVQGKAVLSGAFSDTAAGRIAVYKTHEDGYITNIHTGKKVQGGDRDGVRAQVLLEPDANFSARLIADYNREDSNNGTLVFYNAGASGKFLAQAAAVGGHPVTDPRLRQVNLDSGSHVDVHQGGVSGELNWKLANEYKLTSISAARLWNFTPHNDDGLEVPVTLNVGSAARHRQFTQELRLATPLGQPVESVFGAYYYYQNLDNINFTYNGPLADKFNGTPAGAWSNVTSIGNGHLRVNSYALFGQSIWHIDPQWDLTGGVRATYEDKLAQVTRDAPYGGVAVTGAALASRNARFGAYDSGDVHLNKLSPSALLTLAYKADTDVLAFASASHGEKSGGINLSVPGAAGVSSLKVNNEKANNLELGIKSNLLGRRVQFNASLFWNDVSGYQSNAYDPVSATSYLTNAGTVRSRGLELDSSVVLVRGFTVSANGSFNDVKYKEYKNAPCPPERAGTFCDLSGRAALVNAPRWIGNLAAQYATAVAANVEAYGNLNYAYRSSTYGTLDASEYARIPAYSLTNLSAGLKLRQGSTRWDVSLWAKNLFDKQYYTSMWNTSPGAYNTVIGTPRQIGLTARADF